MPDEIIVRDIETRSTVDLTEVGTYNYATHPSTEIICVGYCVNDAPPKLWHPGEAVPAEILHAAKNGGQFIAHNAAFEIAIERYILVPKFGFPKIPIERNFCTMAAARAMALPASLEKCAAALSLKWRKDVIGKRAMLQTTKPRKARKSEDRDKIYWYNDPERLQRVYSYCLNDVESERELYRRLQELLPKEFDLWLLDQKINQHGFFIDYELAKAASKIEEDAFPLINAEVNQITGGSVTAVTQVARLKNWLRHQRVIIDDLSKTTIAQLLASKLDPKIHRVLELRQLGSQAAAKKVNAFLMHRQSDGRIRGAFQFHAAGPGRWASTGVQVHNLKRIPEKFDIDKGLRIIRQGSYIKALQEYNNPLEIIGTLMRPMICAQPGNVLFGADFSGIEARITAWLAGEENKLEIFRRYDANKGPDPYVVAAMKIFGITDSKQISKAQRQIGKGAELAFGFQGGANAYRKFSPSGAPSLTEAASMWDKRHGPDRAGWDTDIPETSFSDEEIEDIKIKWRKAHPNIVKLWQNLDQQSRDAIRTGHTQSIGHKLFINYQKETQCGLPVMIITLPSGRDIIYPDTRIYKPQDGPPEKRIRGSYFYDNSSGRWRRVQIYGGLLTENVVQGVARDLLAAALVRLDKAGFKIVLHVHDEVVVEEPKSSKRFDEFTRLMNVIPPWAKGLPVISKSWRDLRYVK